MRTAIPAEEMERYKRAARERWQAEKKSQGERRQRAWELAREAGALLKADNGVNRVVAFGSLVHPGRFTQWSDIDLAAWGLRSDNWLKAMGSVRDLSREIEVNLVDVACCSPELLAAIERDGVPL